MSSPGRGLALSTKNKRKQKELIGFVGIGLDAKDEHKRLTRTENFVLLGGSVETHERMQSTAAKFNEKLENKGKKLPETPVEEVLELFRKSME